MLIQLDQATSQQAFGSIVGISQQAVSQMLSKGVLSPGGSAGQWVLEYCLHLREAAAGRATDGSIDLPTERALLARAQRQGQEIKNKVAEGLYAPIESLTDVLANAAQAAVDHFEQIPASINRVCPGLDQAVRDLIMATIANARNEFVRKTASLISDALEPCDLQEEPDLAGQEEGNGSSNHADSLPRWGATRHED